MNIDWKAVSNEDYPLDEPLLGLLLVPKVGYRILTVRRYKRGELWRYSDGRGWFEIDTRFTVTHWAEFPEIKLNWVASNDAVDCNEVVIARCEFCARAEEFGSDLQAFQAGWRNVHRGEVQRVWCGNCELNTETS